MNISKMAISHLNQIIWILTLAIYIVANKPDNNKCIIYQGGCAFHVVLAGSECMSGDAPAQAYGYSAHKSNPASIKYGYQLSSEGPEKLNTEVLKENVVETSKVIIKEELEDTNKRFEDLEKKLTNLMEGLSVRSLRHFRKIKSEISQVKSTVNEISKEGKKASRKSGDQNDNECPAEFITAGTWTSCYRFSNFAATWREAREYCTASGANLVAFETVKEAYILDFLIKSNPQFEKPKGWWTGGNYIARNQRWMWITRHHVRPINFDRWAENEPNSRSTMHCMLMSKAQSYNWEDAMCTDKNNFICEFSLR